jgi:heat shock protein HslJ
MKIVLPAALAAMLLSACGAMPSKEPPPKPFIGTKWVVLLELPIDSEQPWFRFGDGRMDGFGGCNRVAARMQRDAVGAGAIALGRIERGTKACDPSSLAAEQHVLEVLQAVSSYTVDADMLTMNGSAGTLKFRSDPPMVYPK